MLITFEGIDGSGKSTQTKLLKKWFEKKGYEVILTEEPTNNVIGKELKKHMSRNGLSWVEALLFAADRAIHCERIIIPNLDKVVICDRYVHSTIAYQTAIGLKKKWVSCLNENVPKPDLTFYLDIKPETALKRIKKRTSRLQKYETIKLLKKVRHNYLLMKSNKFKVINAEKSIDEIQKSIRCLLNDFM